VPKCDQLTYQPTDIYRNHMPDPKPNPERVHNRYTALYSTSKVLTGQIFRIGTVDMLKACEACADMGQL